MRVLHVLCDRILGNSLLDELRLAVVLLHMVLRGLHLRRGTKSPPVQALGESRCSTSQGLLYHRAAVAIQQPETWFGQYAWIFQMDSDRRVNVSDIQKSQGNEQEVSTHRMTSGATGISNCVGRSRVLSLPQREVSVGESLTFDLYCATKRFDDRILNLN